jgi:hypothetical protein
MIGIIVTGLLCTHKWQLDAVTRGHAEYYLDKHYDRQWRWK